MEKRNFGSLGLRAISSLVMVPVVVASVYFGDPFWFLLLLLIGAMLSWEWSTMIKTNNPALYATIYTLCMVVSVMFPLSLLWMVIILAAGILTAYKARKEEHPRLLILGVPYISLGIGTMMWIYQMTDWVGVMWLILAVWSVDVGGYIVGTSLRGPKLAPKISPNKTWSGLIGGVLLAGVVCGSFCYYLGLRNNPLWILVGGAMALAVVAQIGDLFESAIKRRLGLKDSSNLIPGHGGVFDRIDGLLLAAPVLYLVIILL